ncbi:hypothetical protein DIPPA_01687 [Diplonema papillatum]|nr:hypothetical protein DIPPA_01687 [Diplonema papillatum]
MKKTVVLRKSGWFEPPPERKKFHYCQAITNVPGFPTDKPIQDPFWMESAMTGYYRYAKRGPDITSLARARTAWEGDESKGIPKMPPVNHFGNKLIPRDEAAKFMPDIMVDGLADEIQGPIRTMAKHIVPHQFHEFYDESLVTEGAFGRRDGMDKSRDSIWKANFALYVNRHHMADEMQRKFQIGDARAQDKFQDEDDVEYERDIVAALQRGDIDKACSLYKRLADPPRNWAIYTMMVRHFASRGLLSDAVSVYDEMEMFQIPPDADFLEALLDCCIAAEHPVRTVWAVGEARKPHLGGRKVPLDRQHAIAVKAIRYLLDAAPDLAARVYGEFCKKTPGNDRLPGIIHRGNELLARAQSLGILPAEDGHVPHHHRYAYSLTASEPSGAEAESNATVEPSAAVPADPAACGVPALSDEEVARLEELLVEPDPPVGYFKKSRPNDVIQDKVLVEFAYGMVKGATQARGPSARNKDLLGNVIDPQTRYTFRWGGPNTRMVGDAGNVPSELWF